MWADVLITDVSWIWDMRKRGEREVHTRYITKMSHECSSWLFFSSLQLLMPVNPTPRRQTHKGKANSNLVNPMLMGQMRQPGSKHHTDLASPTMMTKA
jgi:hypothetical protein